MATQGIVTVVSGRRKVLMKVVVGCDGYRAEEFADALRAAWPLDADAAHALAASQRFGELHCRVVMTPDSHRFDGFGALDPAYRRTFRRARWNPRWELGTADHVVVVRV